LLVEGENDSTDVIVKFQEYMEYDDLRYFTMISMLEFLKSHSDVSCVTLHGQQYLDIILCCLLHLCKLDKSEKRCMCEFT